MATQHSMKYFEASAMSNHNVETFMHEIMDQIYHKRFSSFTEQRLPTFKLRASDVNRDSTLKNKTKTGNCKQC